MFPGMFIDPRDLKLIGDEVDDLHRLPHLLIFERIAFVDLVTGLVYG